MDVSVETTLQRVKQLSPDGQRRAARAFAEVVDELEAEEQRGQPRDTRSLYERAQHLIGSIEGPGDLSANKRHLEGFGERSLS